MGVLKVWDGTDWRKVGCGGGTLSDIMQTIDHSTYNSWLSPNVYDGNRVDWTGMGFGTNNWVIDLDGVSTWVDHVNLLLYYSDSRTYINLGLDGSDDYTTWTTIRSPATYQPSVDGIAGLDIPVGASFRYLRFHCDGNSINTNNEWVELEVWAGTAPGRLRMQLPDLSWVQEVCDDDLIPGTETFSYVNTTETFVVPADVTTLTVECWGAEGGPADTGPNVGGLGGYIKADIAVTPGETLTIGVGGAGATNGGGTFGGGASDGSGVDGAGAGGGRSYVNRSTTALVVAGGGGGASSAVSGGGSGGHGGAGTGATGTGGGSSGGGGGTTSAGGAGGAGNGFDGRPVQAPSGAPGTSGNGGAGGGSGFTSQTGGGGGGGYYGGGGGGAAWGSGVGGAGGGGGGSNYSSGSITTNSQGVRSGNGQITLTWSPEAHPLKIEDPASPGDWITVACFRPV